MNGKDLLNKMVDIDPDLIIESDIPEIHKRKETRTKIVVTSVVGLTVAAASLLLVNAGLLKKTKDNQLEIRNRKEYSSSRMLFIDNQDDLVYVGLADAEDRLRYGLPENVDDEVITKEDIGEYAGVVTGTKDDENGNDVGRKVYHYSKYPDNSSILILEEDDTYSFISTIGYEIDFEEGDLSNEIFTKYGLPEKGIKIEVYGNDDQLIHTITDMERIEKVIDLLNNCTNIGLTENNRRLVEAWKEQYGNDAVYLDEDTGLISYRPEAFYPATETAAEISTETSMEETTEVPTEPTTETTLEETTEVPTEPPTETTAEESSEVIVETTADETMETTAEITTDLTTEEASASTTEFASETTLESISEMNAEPVTETSEATSAELTEETFVETVTEETEKLSGEVTEETTSEATMEVTEETTEEIPVETTRDSMTNTTVSQDTMKPSEVETEQKKYELSEIKEMADALWKKGSLTFVIEVREGYRIRIHYSPVSRTYSAFNGFFDLASGKMRELESILLSQ